jgi:hypothetical protein
MIFLLYEYPYTNGIKKHNSKLKVKFKKEKWEQLDCFDMIWLSNSG